MASKLPGTVPPVSPALRAGYIVASRATIDVDRMNGSTTYGYDVYGNRTRETRLGHTLRYTFDAGNRVKTITYPSGMLITYVYDAVGRVKDVTRTEGTLATPIISNRTYRADGLMKAQSFGNGLSETRSHDLQGRLQNQALGSVYNRAYPLYDANGNVKQITATSTPAFSGQYGYDALDRLIQDTNNINSHGFGYDGNGNRTLDNAQLYIYAPNTNRLSTVAGVALIHDAAGNITQDNLGRTYTYDAPGRLASVTVNGVTTNYRYNALGQRTQKQYQNGTTLRYYTGQNGELLAETDSNGAGIAEYVYAEGIPIAQLRYAPEPSSAPTPPTLTGFWPNSGSANAMIFIFGSGFVPNQTQVRVNGINATLVQVVSSDLLIFLLPAGNTNGPVCVTTSPGSGCSATPFGTTLPGVAIASIWPGQGRAGAFVFIFGAGFDPAPGKTKVSLGGTPLAFFQVIDASLMVFSVPAGATSGTVRVTTPLGAATSVASFTVVGGGVPPNAVVTYLYTDQLGTPRAGTDQNGVVSWRWESAACGDSAPTGTATVNLRFPGMVADKETGNFYNWHRYFDPRMCRYISSDPIGLRGGPNTYTYGFNNPLHYTDPTGLWSPGAHDEIFQGAFGNRLSSADIVRLQQSSRTFDRNTQSANQSFMHSMANRNQSVADAVRLRDQFINQTLEEAWKLAKAGNRNAALARLGEACHPIMDSSSPMHINPDGTPKIWNPKWPFGHSPNDSMGNETVHDLSPAILQQQEKLLNEVYDRVFNP